MSRKAMLLYAFVLSTLMARPAWATLEADMSNTVETSDLDVKLSFEQKVDPVRSKLQLIDAAGNAVELHSHVRTDNTQTTLIVAVDARLPPGEYRIKWKVHFVGQGVHSGTTALRIDAPQQSALSK